MRVPIASLMATLLATSGALADWSNIGGNERTNGLVAAIGPSAATEIWSRTNLPSLISWTPIVEGDRIFVVRQTQAQNPVVGPGDSIVRCLSMSTGASLWNFDCPFTAGDWTTVVYGAKDGRVFVGRGGNGSSVLAPIYCLNAATGAVLWVSAFEIATGSYDGVVFMDDGDPIFTSHLEVRRVDAVTGTTVWATPRSCSVSGSCGPTRDGDAIYVDEVGPSGQVISRFSGSTGQKLYSSPVLPGFLTQNSPLCAPGGLIFYLRTQNNAAVDRFYALRDTGTGIEILWSQPARYEFNARHAITPDGGVTMISPAGNLEVRDQLTGALRHQSAMSVVPSGGFLSSMTIVDQLGRIYHSNGGGGNPGDIRVFDPSLQLQWSLSVPGLNQGGPVITADGSLLVANTSAIRRYWTAPPCAPADLNCDGTVNAADLTILLSAWGPCGKGACPADIDGDGTVGGPDITALLSAWG